MLFKNQYTMLKKANDLSAGTLTADDRLYLENLCRGLNILTWNCYEIERIRKDLIEIAARCELEGRTLQQEVGGDTERFLLELAPDLPRGTPLDDVCTWYPFWMLVEAVLYLLLGLAAGGGEANLFHVLTGPLRFMVWLLIWAWFQRAALKLRIRYGSPAQMACYALMLLVFVGTCLFPVKISQQLPGTIPFAGAALYHFAWAAGCQVWQTVHYNRCAARRPWQ